MARKGEREEGEGRAVAPWLHGVSVVHPVVRFVAEGSCCVCDDYGREVRRLPSRQVLTRSNTLTCVKSRDVRPCGFLLKLPEGTFYTVWYDLHEFDRSHELSNENVVVRKTLSSAAVDVRGHIFMQISCEPEGTQVPSLCLSFADKSGVRGPFPENADKKRIRRDSWS